MSVIVKGREMPNNCQECVCINDEYFYCQAVGRQPQDENVISQRPDWCPLVEVPPHGRLIDANVAYDKIAEAASEESGNYVDMDVVDRGLSETPTIIEAEE